MVMKMNIQRNKKPKIQAFIFDFGGVMTTSAPRIFLNDLAVKEELEIDKILPVWKDLLAQAILGKITEDQLFTQFIDRIDLEKPLEIYVKKLEKDLRNCEDKDEEMLNFIKLLKEDHPDLKMALLSNAVKEWMADLEKPYRLRESMDEIIYSFELGIAKPDPKIYQAALDKLKLKPEHCVFIDNNEVNVKAAQALGIKSILYSNFEQFKKDIEPVLKEVQQ